MSREGGRRAALLCGALVTLCLLLSARNPIRVTYEISDILEMLHTFDEAKRPREEYAQTVKELICESLSATDQEEVQVSCAGNVLTVCGKIGYHIKIYFFLSRVRQAGQEK